MESIRLGVVGVGHLGYHHARLYASMPGVDLVGVVDVRQEHGEKVAEEFGTAFFPTVKDLVEAGAQGASVAVPTTAHHAVVKELLEAGVDVLVEKPIAATLEEARDLVDIAAKSGRLLQVGHVERFNGAVIALADHVKNPLFIECHRLSPYSGRGDDVSVVLDLMIHDLDVILALVQSPVESVDAVGIPIFSKEEDIANVRLRFETGCVANVTASRISIDRMRKIRVFADDAYVSTDYSEQEILVYRKKPGALPPDTTPMEWISIEPLEVTREEPLRIELRSFADCVRTREKPIVPGEDGLRALELAFEILHQCRARMP
jgi:predicted dehydrogenase